MIKFKITSDRMEEALSILDFMGVSGKNQNTIMRVAPRFILGADGEYLVKVIYDADGDIESLENISPAMEQMGRIPASRLKKLMGEFAEAAQNIVNPPKGGGLEKPTDTG